MSVISGPVSVTINGVDISDHVTSISSDDADEANAVGWAYPASWLDEDSVWIATAGVYHEQEILGVYLSLDDAFADFPNDSWLQRGDGHWWNGRDHGECVNIRRHPISLPNAGTP